MSKVSGIGFLFICLSVLWFGYSNFNLGNAYLVNYHHFYDQFTDHLLPADHGVPTKTVNDVTVVVSTEEHNFFEISERTMQLYIYDITNAALALAGSAVTQSKVGPFYIKDRKQKYDLRVFKPPMPIGPCPPKIDCHVPDGPFAMRYLTYKVRSWQEIDTSKTSSTLLNQNITTVDLNSIGTSSTFKTLTANEILNSGTVLDLSGANKAAWEAFHIGGPVGWPVYYQMDGAGGIFSPRGYFQPSPFMLFFNSHFAYHGSGAAIYGVANGKYVHLWGSPTLISGHQDCFQGTYTNEIHPQDEKTLRWHWHRDTHRVAMLEFEGKEEMTCGQKSGMVSRYSIRKDPDFETTGNIFWGMRTVNDNDHPGCLVNIRNPFAVLKGNLPLFYGQPNFYGCKASSKLAGYQATPSKNNDDSIWLIDDTTGMVFDKKERSAYYVHLQGGNLTESYLPYFSIDDHTKRQKSCEKTFSDIQRLETASSQLIATSTSGGLLAIGLILILSFK